MTDTTRRITLPLEDELGLHRLTNPSGLEIGVLPNGCLFTIEHVAGEERTMVSQVFGSPLGGGIARVLLRLGRERRPVAIAGAGARVRVGARPDRFVWDGETAGVKHRVTLWLHPRQPLWLWRVDLENTGGAAVECDAVLVQDLGLGARGLVMANEAYASQYIDHTISRHSIGTVESTRDSTVEYVLFSRQNMAQYGRNPWVSHGCLEGAASFATDAAQLFGPRCRETGDCTLDAEAGLPDERLQGEAACAAIQSAAIALAPGEAASRSFFGLFEAHHPEASGDADLARLDAVAMAAAAFRPAEVALSEPRRSVLAEAAPLAVVDLTGGDIRENYPSRRHEERRGGALLSFFTPDGAQNRHVVLAAKERQMRRRHGAILRSGTAILPDEATLSATCWMHGVFGAQLTIGNTALHKLFSVSRDPYNITCASGLRILVDRGEGWRLLTVPSVFDIGLNDCRWVYRLADGDEIAVHALVPAEDAAMQWDIAVSGKACRFTVLAHAIMGEHEFRHPGAMEVDEAARRISFRPEAGWIWAETYPRAVHHLVTSTPDAVEAVGSGALLFEADAPRGADAWAAIRTRPANRFSFALVGALDDPELAAQLAAKYERGIDKAALAKAGAFWSHVTGDAQFSAERDTALDTIFPWLAHNAMIHLSVPRGLEQYSAAAWGTRDVCQGPVELLLPLGHHQPVRDILRVVFSQQYQHNGDWPQWFMLEPYRTIRDRHSHGDIIVWPLKALCDYLEATRDYAFLQERLPWTAEDFSLTAQADPVAVHIERLLAGVQERFIPHTHLIRYGLGDWNDALQPADPAMRDWMVSAWTVALLYQQVIRYSAILASAGQPVEAEALADLAERMRRDYNRHLMPGGTVAGYALFSPNGGAPEPIMHPDDHRTGVRYSLIAMTRAVIAGLFTPEQAKHHMRLVREHLQFPDGARLMDRPVEYHGGLEVNFRRAESASFFGREIGLMYAHSHLRYCEALGAMGDIEAAKAAMRLVNPIAVTDDLANASLRQRNTFFSSSDAAFRDRAQASAEWARVKEGSVAVDGGWRIYSSGAGIFTRLALEFARASKGDTPQA
jgi:1,2-beta-oligoglucan phosphorylase